MTVTITHQFVSGVADGGDASVVQPSNWNANHVITGLTSSDVGLGSVTNDAQTKASNYPNGAVSGFMVISKLIDFSVGNTDTAITTAIPLPTGFTRYYILNIKLNGASASINGATASIWSATGGTGTNIVANATAITLAVTAENTAANSQLLTLAMNSNTESVNFQAIYFRVQATAAGTAWVTLNYQPAS